MDQILIVPFQRSVGNDIEHKIREAGLVNHEFLEHSRGFQHPPGDVVERHSRGTFPAREEYRIVETPLQ